MKKFGMKIDLDEMEEAVLTHLLMEHPRNYEDMKQEENDIRKLKVFILFSLYSTSI